MNDGGKNDPLPVKSQEQAEHLVRGLVDSLAEEYGLKVDGKTVHKEFRDCFGKEGESTDDGRFDLTYAVRAALPEAEHGTAIRAMRKRLEAQGYKISGYREDKTKDPWALMDAKGGKDNLVVSVESYMPPDQLVFSVNTPCFLPPGVKQQQVSAPATDTAPVTPKDPRLALMAPTGPASPENPFG
ncbi:hypothetical protein SSP35_24_00480 [Streptomyces sp. NBRC 110611]|uniref:hypothetical protein n=1 Tax=Streptomyces sp. NBRC 110611 TaxID=1621259 RepID=UPI00082EF405|nr:hypothetical protein [Streptomyces sp. NBRC 110611]GAU70943.1 hypothetical protein SSP35_24_00480 [Streptomyces sp. NBRC 110611]